MYEWAVDDVQVELVLTKLAFLLSPPGLSAFLGTEVGPYLQKRAKARFAEEGDDASGKWAPLKPATIQIRESMNYGSGPINVRTGELENWVTQGNWDAYPTGYGASLKYPGNTPSGELADKVETAQAGRKYPSTVPRPVLATNETDMLFVLTAFAATFMESVKPL